MTYNHLKPDAGPSPALDAPTMRTNFAQFASIFSNTLGGVTYNHSALNLPEQGNHESVLMERRSADPSVNQTLDVLYNKQSTIAKAGNQPQLTLQIPKFLPNQNDPYFAKNEGMQLTYNQVNVAGPVYQSFIPGGRVFKIGRVVYLLYFGVDSGNYVLNTNVADTVILTPAPTKILVAIANPNNMTTVGSPIANLVSTEINTVTNDRFIIRSNFTGNAAGNPYSFTWMALAIA